MPPTDAARARRLGSLLTHGFALRQDGQRGYRILDGNRRYVTVVRDLDLDAVETYARTVHKRGRAR